MSSDFYHPTMVDADGKTEFSKLVRIEFDKTFTAGISPNRSQSRIHVSVTYISEPLLLKILEINGKLIKTRSITSQTTNVNDTRLSRGFDIAQKKDRKGLIAKTGHRIRRSLILKGGLMADFFTVLNS